MDNHDKLRWITMSPPDKLTWSSSPGISRGIVASVLPRRRPSRVRRSWSLSVRKSYPWRPATSARPFQEMRLRRTCSCACGGFLYTILLHSSSLLGSIYARPKVSTQNLGNPGIQSKISQESFRESDRTTGIAEYSFSRIRLEMLTGNLHIKPPGPMHRALRTVHV